MNRPSRTRHFWIVLPLALLPLGGCVQGEDVNPRTLARARRAWDQARPANYDLEWTTSGARDGHYFVTVREGTVQSVESVGPDGKKTLIHPPDPSYYSVDGLFLALETESEQALKRRPFGLPEGTVPKLEFETDPRLGYPLRYRRHVNRAGGRLALDVLRLETDIETSKSDGMRS
jgi:hypothetical protein